MLKTGVGGFALLLLLTACGANPHSTAHALPSTVVPSATGSTAPAQPSAPECTQGLEMKAGPVGTVSGRRTLVLIFTNASSSACTLEGYPSVDLMNPGGGLLVRAKRVPSGPAGGAPIVPLTLEPGQVASALVEASAGNCDSAALRVVPPGQFTPLPLGSMTMPRCDLQVHPVVAGNGGGLH